MRYPQVLIYETDGVMAGRLRDLEEAKRRLPPAERAQQWSIREPRSTEACIRLLRRSGPAVLVIKLGRDLFRELSLLEQAAWLFPEAGRVVVGDSQDAVLAGLAWDLGADYVLFPPQSREQLVEILAGLLRPVSATPLGGQPQPSAEGDEA